MNGMFWLLVLCVLVVLVLAGISLWKRMLAEELPEYMAGMVWLYENEGLETQLEALQLQLTWTDSDLLSTIFLVDGTKDGQLAEVCRGFCRKHPQFRYCKAGELSELVNIFGNIKERQKNDCNLSKKQV